MLIYQEVSLKIDKVPNKLNWIFNHFTATQIFSPYAKIDSESASYIAYISNLTCKSLSKRDFYDKKKPR